MTQWTRRDLLKTAGALAAATVASPNIGIGAEPHARGFTPEKGAKLRLLRWKRFVQGDEDAWLANTKKFTQATGVEVQIDNEGWEDVRPKAAVAANIGNGPDIILGWFDDPHLYPDKLVDLTDLAEHLGKKYGGWYPVCREYGTRGNSWIGLPIGVTGEAVVYRESLLHAAGFDTFPKDTDGFLKLCQGLKAKGKPAGLALGNAVGDATTWCHWLIWSHGGKLVDDNNNVAINSKETLAALEYAKALYQTFVPGTLSWLDPNNNKAFLAGSIGLTINGISIYYSAKTSPDPAIRELAKDINHANFPVGPVGRPTELSILTQAMVFKYSKYPQAAKEYLRFMLEADQYNAWLEGANGYITQPLKAYEANPVWTRDPKNMPYRETTKRMLSSGYSGKLGYASAASMADFIVVNMVAEAASGAQTPKAAIERAEKRASRYYKV